MDSEKLLESLNPRTLRQMESQKSLTTKLLWFVSESDKWEELKKDLTLEETMELLRMIHSLK